MSVKGKQKNSGEPSRFVVYDAAYHSFACDSAWRLGKERGDGCNM